MRVAYVDFWPGFEPRDFALRFPSFAAAACVEVVEDPARADIVVFSCFADGRRTTQPRDPRAWTAARGVRIFYTAENVRPDFATCDFALSFCRDLVDERHLRVPNYVGTQLAFGFAPDALLHPPIDPGHLRRSKTRFCTYVQGNRVPRREAFVQALSRYQRVDCAGASLNNTGFVADRRRKHELYRESKFAVTFENEASVGYTSEKLPDALLCNAVPIYWGDPTVDLDFDPRCFLNRRDFDSDEALVARIAELDHDHAAYEAMLAAPRVSPRATGAIADPSLLPRFFERVAAGARATSRKHDAARLAPAQP